jgi:hypothetical protein
MRTSWPLDDWDFERMLESSAVERYVYCVQQVAWKQLVWLLGDSSGYAEVSFGGQRYLSVWPHERFARECVSRWNEALLPQSLQAHTFIRAHVQKSSRTGLCFEVFPIPGSSGYRVTGDELYHDYCNWKTLPPRLLGWREDLPEAPERPEHEHREVTLQRTEVHAIETRIPFRGGHG